MKQSPEDLFHQFLDIKGKRHIQYFDTHVHPEEVLGIPNSAHKKDTSFQPSAPASLLERLHFSTPALFVLEKLFYYAPRYISKEVERNFEAATEGKLLASMDEAGIDISVLMPLLPAVDPARVAQRYPSPRFMRVGSIDIQSIAVGDIEPVLKKQIQEGEIRGVKLHPNLQSFYPRPQDNPTPIRERLETLYSLLNQYNLYAVFHGGISYVPQGRKYIKRDFALIENFISTADVPSVFDLIHTPIIIAHMGSYNVISPGISLLYDIVDAYQHVFFDTAGINPVYIKAFIKKKGSSRLIFGSDARYFNQKYSILSLLSTLRNDDIASDFEENIVNIFHSNYAEHILRT